MKKIILSIVGLICIITLSVVIVSKKEKANGESYLRVHIRANSNSAEDQGIKMQVKTAVVDYLTGEIASGSTFEEVYAILKANLENIEATANKVLAENGFTYKSHASLREEYFPTRSYNDYTLENGYYDALILELGKGEGNNWWCVVYPPLCFIGAEGSDGRNIKYKSKFIEIIQNFFQ